MSLEAFVAIHQTDVDIFQSGPERWTDRQTLRNAASTAKNKSLITPARPHVPPERPNCNCQSRYGSSDGLPAISKTFTQQLLQLNGNRSFIPKHKANGE